MFVHTSAVEQIRSHTCYQPQYDNVYTTLVPYNMNKKTRNWSYIAPRRNLFMHALSRTHSTTALQFCQMFGGGGGGALLLKKNKLLEYQPIRIKSTYTNVNLVGGQEQKFPSLLLFSLLIFLLFFLNWKPCQGTFFVIGEIFNKRESMTFWCSRLSVNFHVGSFQMHIRLLDKVEFPARTPDKSRLNLLTA